VMEVLGKRAWWMPKWMARRLPRLAIEPEAMPAADPA
jgi:uncharacterized membrane protein YdfJ with MMPL/SSD domain